VNSQSTVPIPERSAPAEEPVRALTHKPEPRRPSALPRALPTTEPAAMPDAHERQLARDRELAAERALLEQARTALARGKPADALALLARHQRDYEHGRLGEEREALVILSLLAERRKEAARSLAEEFRRIHPKSMLLRTIDAALHEQR